MVHFSDAANSIIDGPSSVNDNNTTPSNNNTKNNHNDDNDGIDGDDVLDSSIGIGIGISNDDGEETKQRSEEEETTTVKVGQKRLPVTPHPANPNGKNAKKHSPNGVSDNGSGGNSNNNSNSNSNSIHAQTDSCIMQEVESPDTDMMTNASRHFESESSSSSSNNDNKIMDGDQNAEVEAIIVNKDRHQHHDKGKQEKSENDEVGSKDRNNSNSTEKNDEGGEGEESEEDMGVEENDGSDDNDSDNENDHSKRWNGFVDSVDVQETPNLQAYLQEKKTRKCSAEQFENAMDVCIQSLRDTTNELLSDVIEPVCNQYTERFDHTEDDIIKNLVSNHSRRNKLMKRMHDADDTWNNQFHKLTADILNEEIDIEETAEVGEKERNKRTGSDGKDMVVSGDQEDDPHLSSNKDPVVASESTKEKTQAIDEGMYRPKNTMYGHEDSDLDELLDYEPNRERILSFMNGRVKRNETMRSFGTVIDDVHTGLESEVESILQIASNLYVQHREMCENLEYDIESYMMENYGRRSDLQRELENSAQRAQKLFGSLLSRLGSLNGM